MITSRFFLGGGGCRANADGVFPEFSDDTDQPPRQQQCVRIGTEDVPLDTEELYYNQLHWAY